MRMSNFMVLGAFLPDLRSTTREGAIEELIASLQAAGAFATADVPDITAAVLRRETLGSTGIGRGIAIPHSRHAAAGRLVGALGISKAGLWFDSVDDEPVHVVALVVSPQDQPALHLRALEAVVNGTREDETVTRLRACTTADGMWELIP
jgi:PTS system fructose-specific IIA component/PTS system nitrogen regulatory IIA component